MCLQRYSSGHVCLCAKCLWIYITILRLCEYGSLRDNRHKQGRSWVTRASSMEQNLLDIVWRNPRTSVRTVATDVGGSRSSVHCVLQSAGLHSYHSHRSPYACAFCTVVSRPMSPKHALSIPHFIYGWDVLHVWWCVQLPQCAFMGWRESP